MKGHKSIIKVSKKMTRKKKKKLSKASLMIMKSLELKTRYQWQSVRSKLENSDYSEINC